MAKLEDGLDLWVGAEAGILIRFNSFFPPMRHVDVVAVVANRGVKLY